MDPSDQQQQAKAPKPSLPISRNSGPGYDRPERARTSHACEPCRERKTKCDGERPSCRRCLQTGTGCHYGYGKGWRKRKTVEDLNATSQKLQRYESLLSDIIPMCPPKVQAMIEDARQQQDIAISDTPESADSSASLPHMLGDRERRHTNSNPRLPLPLPVPNSLAGQPNRPPSAMPFDHASESTSPHLAHHPKRDLSFDEQAATRLPSITASGLLIENGMRDASPNYPHPGVSPVPNRTDRFSPTSSGFHESPSGWSAGPTKHFQEADNRSSATPSSVHGLNSPSRKTAPSYYDYPRIHNLSTEITS